MLVILLPKAKKGRPVAMNRLVSYKCVPSKSLKKAGINYVLAYVNPQVI